MIMRKYCLVAIALMMSVAIYAQREKWKVTDKGPSIDNYFVPATTELANPDSEGFIRRWTLLEPIDKPNRDNTVFTDSYLREHLTMEYFKG